jgi:hypothetical protein
MSMTLAPLSASRAAALSPASPAPMTRTSYDGAAQPVESRRQVLHVEQPWKIQSSRRAWRSWSP